MNRLMNFFKSKTGKTILWVAIILVLLVLVFRQYEKSIYGGFTKSGAIDEIATRYMKSRIAQIKANDTNYLANKDNPDTVWGIFNWYDVNANKELSDEQFLAILDEMGVDYNKKPKVLEIKPNVDSAIQELKFIDLYNVA